MIEAFLKVPPFPRAQALPLVAPGTSDFDPDTICKALVANRVGGDFWAGAPTLPKECDLILMPDDATQLAAMLREAGQRKVAIAVAPGLRLPTDAIPIPASFDPWALADQIAEVWTGSCNSLALVASLIGRPVRLFEGSGFASRLIKLRGDLQRALGRHAYASPFDGQPWPLMQAIEQLGQWRRLIESNRGYRAVYGVARWKRTTVDPLLWDGTGPVRHSRKLGHEITTGTWVVAWKSRTPPATLATLERLGANITEVEDGMIRSVGLGANCVPPLSIIVDKSGIYFDPNGPSNLEHMLEYDELPVDWVQRASRLRATLVQGGISKYGQGRIPVSVRPDGIRRILVTGQVEDDRSVVSGGENCTNLDLLARARKLEPDAWIIYKPHPDVEAGHRKGRVPDAEALVYADEIQRSVPITALIDQVDGLHVITSLAGFEGLLRAKAVTTHGQPFYAGWGLTRDLRGPNPRRTRQRSLDELTAATLIGYPRYVDPVTRLPCPPEVLVKRIAAGQAQVTSPLITLREWQGKLRRLWNSLGGRQR